MLNKSSSKFQDKKLPIEVGAIMKDKLQRFIRDNREGFDNEEPSDALWNKIRERLPQVVLVGEENETHLKTIVGQNTDKAATVAEDLRKKENKNPFQPFMFTNWRVAAAVILAVGLGWYANHLNQKYSLIEQPSMALNSPNFAKQVSQYTQLIETKRAELRLITETNPDLYREFAVELTQLERSYQNLKSDLPQNPNQEAVIQAMIQNLQWQIDLLNQQLSIIQRIKSKNNNENDKIM